MSNEQQQPSAALAKREPSAVEYIPYGGQDKIKMTVGIIQNLIAVKTKSGKTCSDRDAIKFMAMCQAKRMNPFEGDCFLIGYDGRDNIPNFALVTAHQTYLKRAELHPEFDGMKSGIIIRDENGDLRDMEGDFFVDGQTVVGGWATVFFKTRKQTMHRRLRLARFQKAFGVWQDDPAGMICKCAEADALRSSFPTMLGGLYLREEMPGPDTVTTKPVFSAPKSPALFAPAAAQEMPADGGPAEPERPSNGVESQPESAPEPAPDKRPAQPTGFQPVKALRNLLTMSGIKEGQLLDYLSANGVTDGSVGSIEELAMSNPAAARSLCDTWQTVSAQIKAAPKGD